MRYFTSDLHFHHKKILEFCPNRPKDMAAMHEEIISHWNNTVKDGDDVYVLGDFSFGNSGETKVLINQLKGRKILVMGNHDRRSEKWYRDAGFTVVSTSLMIKIDEFLVQLSHYPHKLSWLSWLYYKIVDPGYTRYQDRKVGERSQNLLHGHCHGKYRVINGRGIDVGWDCWGRLLGEREIVNMLREMK
jgi:calcineurin-like phosphoesterase family protein